MRECTARVFLLRSVVILAREFRSLCFKCDGKSNGRKDCRVVKMVCFIFDVIN